MADTAYCPHCGTLEPFTGGTPVAIGLDARVAYSEHDATLMAVMLACGHMQRVVTKRSA
jgi:hypothetical protein